ncbi:unnamed protein product [Ambrosiozyma monospora]|uniref:Unnamed protein product n=1 Tax=Ambrosiozyma monospora TaxID=43982 RepID=A0ACB5U8U1_AMBMO|nr:unnamed protein product [Ambrosiozyma monospora]
MATNFIKGGKVEQAVDCYEELLEAYKNYNFDLTGLSYCYTELGKAFNALESVGRLESTFFKISYIGYGFPLSIRNKEFIMEGLPFEHITSVSHRIARLYPGSRMIANEDEAKRLFVDIPFGKYIYVKMVKPADSTADVKLSYMTKQYVDHKDMNTFISTRRIPGSTNISNLWTEEVTYETLLTFPTLMNISEVKSTIVVKLSPIKNAIKSILAKNTEF